MTTLQCVNWLKFIQIPGAFAALLLFCSCITLRTHNQHVKIASQPEMSEIYYEGRLIGHTPTFVDLPRSRLGEIVLKKPGYETTGILFFWA